MNNLWRFKKVKELEESGKNFVMDINNRMHHNDEAMDSLVDKTKDFNTQSKRLEDQLSQTFIDLEGHHSNSCTTG